jgi:hypothetical protein
MISRAQAATAVWLGLRAALKMVCLELVRRYSMTSREAATKPPVLARDFERLPLMTSTLSLSPKVIGGAAALAAEHAEAVGVVEHGEAVVFLGDGGELRQAADVPLHRVNALDDEVLGRGGIGGGDNLAEVVRAVVGKAFHRGHGETDAVPETGVEVLVGEDHVALLGEGCDARHAGEVAGGVDVAGFAAEKGGELFLKVHVVGAGPVGGAGAGGAGAPLEEGGAAGLDNLGVKRQAQVVVARQHDHVAPIEPDLRAGLRPPWRGSMARISAASSSRSRRDSG